MIIRSNVLYTDTPIWRVGAPTWSVRSAGFIRKSSAYSRSLRWNRRDRHISCVITGIKLRPQPWGAIIPAAIGKRCLGGLGHGPLVLRGESDVKLGAGGL